MTSPANFSPHTVHDVDLNALFPTFNRWVFGPGRQRKIRLNLFQPGRRQNHGYVEHDGGVRHMMFLPLRPGSDLSDYLRAWDSACTRPYPTEGGCPIYSWVSVAVIPEAQVSERLERKYGRDCHLVPELPAQELPHLSP